MGQPDMTEPIRSRGKLPKRQRRIAEQMDADLEYLRRRRAHEALQAEMHPELAPLGEPRVTTHFSFRDVNKAGSNAGHVSNGRRKPNKIQRARGAK